MVVIADSYKYRRIPGLRSSAKSAEGNKLDNLGKMVRFPTRVEIFLLPNLSTPTLRRNPAPDSMVNGVSFCSRSAAGA